MEVCKLKIDVKAFAIASSIIAVLAFFDVVWWIVAPKKHGHGYWISGLHYKKWISPKGSILGLAWGILEGVVICAMFAKLYNALLVYTMKKEEKGDLSTMVMSLVKGLMAR
jgi:hypothetical protein